MKPVAISLRRELHLYYNRKEYKGNELKKKVFEEKGI